MEKHEQHELKFVVAVAQALDNYSNIDDDVCASKTAALRRYFAIALKDHPQYADDAYLASTDAVSRWRELGGADAAKPVTAWQALDALMDLTKRVCKIVSTSLRSRCPPDPLENCPLYVGAYAAGAADRLLAAIRPYPAPTTELLAAFLAKTVAAHTADDRYIIAANRQGAISLLQETTGSVVGNTIVVKALSCLRHTTLCCAPVRSGHAAMAARDRIITYDIRLLLLSACKADAETNGMCPGSWIVHGPGAAVCTFGRGGYCTLCGTVLGLAFISADTFKELVPLCAAAENADIQKVVRGIVPPSPPTFKRLQQQKEKTVGDYPAVTTVRHFVNAEQARDLDVAKPKPQGRR
jgi:hypothetical protein